MMKAIIEMQAAATQFEYHVSEEIDAAAMSEYLEALCILQSQMAVLALRMTMRG